MSPTFNSLVKCSEIFLKCFLSVITACYSRLQPSFATFEQYKSKQTAKMNDRMLTMGLGTYSFNSVFLKICPYDPISKFQKLEIGSD